LAGCGWFIGSLPNKVLAAQIEKPRSLLGTRGGLRRQAQSCDVRTILSRFGGPTRTDIERNDKNQRGYARVSLQEGGSVASSPEPDPSQVVPP
jgi:hypothetical protein